MRRFICVVDEASDISVASLRGRRSDHLPFLQLYRYLAHFRYGDPRVREKKTILYWEKMLSYILSCREGEKHADYSCDYESTLP